MFFLGAPDKACSQPGVRISPIMVPSKYETMTKYFNRERLKHNQCSNLFHYEAKPLNTRDHGYRLGKLMLIILHGNPLSLPEIKPWRRSRVSRITLVIH